MRAAVCYWTVLILGLILLSIDVDSSSAEASPSLPDHPMETFSQPEEYDGPSIEDLMTHRLLADKRRRGFLGKRRHGFIGKRRHGFIGKRRHGFIGKRRHGFIGKRRHGFIGKRRHGFIGKRRHGFIGKRRHGFIGKRRRGFLGKRRHGFMGKRPAMEWDSSAESSSKPSDVEEVSAAEEELPIGPEADIE